MNQELNFAARKCVFCNKRNVWVRQEYNTHLAEYQDAEIPVCVECEEERGKNERYII